MTTAVTTMDEAVTLADRTPGAPDWNIEEWRAAHSWLKGYSDAQLSKPSNTSGTFDKDAYRRGYESGRA